MRVSVDDGLESDEGLGDLAQCRLRFLVLLVRLASPLDLNPAEGLAKFAEVDSQALFEEGLRLNFLPDIEECLYRRVVQGLDSGVHVFLEAIGNK